MTAETSVAVEGSSPSEPTASTNTHNLNNEDSIIAVVEDGNSNIKGYRVLSLGPTDNSKPFELQVTPAATLPIEFVDRWFLTGLPTHLGEGQVFVLVSTQSGTGLASDFSVIVQKVLEEAGLPVSQQTIVRTQNAESVKDFVTTTLLPGANYGRKQTVVLLSGDGGIVESINAIEHAGQRSRLVNVY